MGAWVILAITFAAFVLGFIVAWLFQPKAEEKSLEPGRVAELSEVLPALTTMLANGIGRLLSWHACRSWAVLQGFKGYRAEYRQGLADAAHLGAVAPVYPVGASPLVVQSKPDP
jgi:hypothetical protein